MMIKTFEDFKKKYIDMSQANLEEHARVKNKLERIGVDFFDFSAKDLLDEPLIYLSNSGKVFKDFLHNSSKLDKTYQEISIEEFLKE